MMVRLGRFNDKVGRLVKVGMVRIKEMNHLKRGPKATGSVLFVLSSTTQINRSLILRVNMNRKVFNPNLNHKRTTRSLLGQYVLIVTNEYRTRGSPTDQCTVSLVAKFIGYVGLGMAGKV